MGVCCFFFLAAFLLFGPEGMTGYDWLLERDLDCERFGVCIKSRGNLESEKREICRVKDKFSK